MSSILKSVIRKEFIHIWKDPQTLLIILAMPIIMLFLFGYAITMEMRDIPTIVTDLSHTKQSRYLIEKIGANNFFKVQLRDVTEKEVDFIFQSKAAKCIIVIPRDYGRTIQNNRETNIQVLIDASDPNAATNINSYLNYVLYDLTGELNHGLPVPFTLEQRFLYNPDLHSANFFVPGLIAVILLMVSALLTSITIAREKETGTMEQILVSPIRPLQIIIGKVVPYILIGFICGLMILFLGIILFHVPLYGSLLAILLTMILYIFTGLSFGLLISTVTKTQQTAMLITLMVTMLPTIMLSGFIFPLDSMPVGFRVMSNIIPATHFINIIRGIMLKGISLFELGRQILFLSALSFLLLFISIKKYKSKLE